MQVVFKNFGHYIYINGDPIQIEHDMYQTVPNFQGYFDPYDYK